MSNATPNDPAGGPGARDQSGWVESCVGDNVITIIADDGGYNTLGPAPEHARRYLEKYRRRLQQFGAPPADS